MTDQALPDIVVEGSLPGGFKGEANVYSGNSEFNALSFLINQILGRVYTATLVQVQAVTLQSDTEPMGYVDARLLVQQLDGWGNAISNATIHHIPYFRLQAGACAVVIDPVVGDIGVCLFADRDISAVKTSKAEAPPGSRRRFDMADGLYIGAFLGNLPTDYVKVSPAGIKIKSGVKVEIEAPVLTHNGHNIGATHTHGGVQAGTSNTGTPT